MGALAAMIIGMIWYGPLFGKMWMELVGMTPEMHPEAKRKAQTSYIFMTVSAIVLAYVIGLFLKNMLVISLVHALTVAFFAWLGFIATSMASEYLFNAKPKPWSLYAINAGYYLVNVLVIAAIYFWLR